MSPLTIGWREVVRLPDHDVAPIRAKIDTGAKTSALHARWLRLFDEDGAMRVSFRLHSPAESWTTLTFPVKEFRVVKSSNGKTEERPTIQTSLSLGGRSWLADVTLTNRREMRFDMLIGRDALKGFLVDPKASYLLGKL